MSDSLCAVPIQRLLKRLEVAYEHRRRAANKLASADEAVGDLIFEITARRGVKQPIRKIKL